MLHSLKKDSFLHGILKIIIFENDKVKHKIYNVKTTVPHIKKKGSTNISSKNSIWNGQDGINM